MFDIGNRKVEVYTGCDLYLHNFFVKSAIANSKKYKN